METVRSERRFVDGRNSRRRHRIVLCCLGISSMYGQSMSTVVGAGYSAPSAIDVAPGQAITIFVQGIDAKVPLRVVANGAPLPTTLAGISVSLTQSYSNKSIQVPLFAVFPVNTCLGVFSPGCGHLTGITLQLPFELGVNIPGTSAAPISAQLFVAADGISGGSIELTPLPDQIHVLTSNDTIMSSGSGGGGGTYPRQPMIAHADGNLVTGANQARGGEVLVIYAVGLGYTTPVVKSGELSPSPPSVASIDAASAASIDLGIVFRANASPTMPPAPAPAPVARLLFAGLTPGMVGLYQINFTVPEPPPGTLACTFNTWTILWNATVTITGQTSFDEAKICVQSRVAIASTSGPAR